MIKPVANTARSESLLQEVYLRLRRPAFALALSNTLDADKAYACVTQNFVHAGKRIRRKSFSETSILPRLLRALPCESQSGKGFSGKPAALASLDKDARSVWALIRVARMDEEEGFAALHMDKSSGTESLSRADAAMNPQDALDFACELDNLTQRHEIWNTVSFTLQQQMRTTRYVRLAFTAILGIAVLLLLSREAYLGIKIMSFPGPKTQEVLADSIDSPEYYKNFSEHMSKEQTRISTALAARLEGLEDEQLIRAAFRFYDDNLMRGVLQDGETLLSLHTMMYDVGLSFGKAHRLMANAISLYYANYERPFMPDERKTDFSSDFRSIYDAAMSLAQDGGFSGTFSAHPEIFASRENFDSYLYSKRFLSVVYPVSDLLLIEKNLTSELREEYEKLIFAFDNPLGLNGTLSTDSFYYTSKQTDHFYTLREALGKEFYARNLAKCLELLPDALVTSDILEGNESSLFSATLSKKDILALAKNDPRFVFLGIAAPFYQGYPERVEHALADMADKKLFDRYEVFQIDEEYILYSVNYAAPLRLPQGFIDELRQTRACKDTQYELLLQYNYHMRFAHPQTRSGYGLLRALYSNPLLQFASTQFKPFSKMASF